MTTTNPIPLSTLQDVAGAGAGDVMAVRVHAELLRLAPTSGVVEVLQHDVAESMTPTVSVKSVYRALQDLIAADCIQVDRIGNRPNEYRLIRDLASARIALNDLYARRRGGMSEEMSGQMSGVSGAVGVEAPIAAQISQMQPMSGAAGDTQPIRARDSVSSSSSSSRSDTTVRSETNVDLQDPEHLQVAGLILAAHIDPTREACEALALLTRPEQLQALRLALRATEPNPKYLVACVGTVMRKRGATRLPSILPLLYPDSFVGDDLAELDACDELSRRDAADDGPTAAPTESAGLPTPAVVRGVTPRAGSTPRRVSLDRRAWRLAQGELLIGARVAAGLNQREAAKAAGISAGALSTYETGNREAVSSVLAALADIYGVPYDALLPLDGGAA